jgi:mono/diheme cytochrome c family protein
MILPAQRRFGLGWCLAIVIATVSWATAAAEQQSMVQAEQGKRIFQRHCADCHGREGTGEGYRLLGADPANLTSRQTQEKSDENLLESIHEGQPAMPAWKDRLSNEDRQRVLAYIRSLAK